MKKYRFKITFEDGKHYVGAAKYDTEEQARRMAENYIKYHNENNVLYPMMEAKTFEVIDA